MIPERGASGCTALVTSFVGLGMKRTLSTVWLRLESLGNDGIGFFVGALSVSIGVCRTQQLSLRHLHRREAGACCADERYVLNQDEMGFWDSLLHVERRGCAYQDPEPELLTHKPLGVEPLQQLLAAG